jgi:hypothetical protein
VCTLDHCSYQEWLSPTGCLYLVALDSNDPEQIAAWMGTKGLRTKVFVTSFEPNTFVLITCCLRLFPSINLLLFFILAGGLGLRGFRIMGFGCFWFSHRALIEPFLAHPKSVVNSATSRYSRILLTFFWIRNPDLSGRFDLQVVMKRTAGIERLMILRIFRASPSS